MARGPENAGCGCQYTEFGCCPDNYTPAAGEEYGGCPCNTYRYGCCPDGVSIAKGPGTQGKLLFYAFHCTKYVFDQCIKVITCIGCNIFYQS